MCILKLRPTLFVVLQEEDEIYSSYYDVSHATWVVPQYLRVGDAGTHVGKVCYYYIHLHENIEKGQSHKEHC